MSSKGGGGIIKNANYAIAGQANSDLGDVEIVGVRIKDCDTGIRLRSPNSSTYGALVNANKISDVTDEHIVVDDNSGSARNNISITANHCTGTGSGIVLNDGAENLICTSNLAAVTDNTSASSVVVANNQAPQ